MKIIVLLCLLSCVYSISNGQIAINGVDLNTKAELQYLVLDYKEGSAPGTKNRRGFVSIDYGQDYENAKETILKDDKGEFRMFNSLTEVLNLFYKNGWKFCNTYAYGNAGGTQYRIVLERINEK